MGCAPAPKQKSPQSERVLRAHELSDAYLSSVYHTARLQLSGESPVIHPRVLHCFHGVRSDKQADADSADAEP